MEKIEGVSVVGKRVKCINDLSGAFPDSIPKNGSTGTIIDENVGMEEWFVEVCWDDEQALIGDKLVNNCSEIVYELVKLSDEKPPMTRKSLLDDAAKIITCDREKQYGAPEDNFGRIARHWSVYMDTEITAHDVSILMTLLKIARIESGQVKEDNYVDAIGYLACGGEIAGGDK